MPLESDVYGEEDGSDFEFESMEPHDAQQGCRSHASLFEGTLQLLYDIAPG